MRPVHFEHANKILQPSDRRYSDKVASISPLPVWTDDERCVSCWKMSLRERLSALLFGRVWLAILSGETQPPACLLAARSYLEIDKQRPR